MLEDFLEFHCQWYTFCHPNGIWCDQVQQNLDIHIYKFDFNWNQLLLSIGYSILLEQNYENEKSFSKFKNHFFTALDIYRQISLWLDCILIPHNAYYRNMFDEHLIFFFFLVGKKVIETLLNLNNITTGNVKLENHNYTSKNRCNCINKKHKFNGKHFLLD